MPPSESKSDIIRSYFKQWPWFYYLMKIVFSPVMYGGMTAKKFLKKYPRLGKTLNMGSGPRRLGPDITNVDIHPFVGVDIVADVLSVPFADNSVSRIISDNVLEHVTNPVGAVKEMYRVLSKDGIIYASTPFMYPFHASPHDYQRWTEQGLTELFKDFEILEIGVRGGGPFSALSVTLCYLGATIFSFGAEKLYWVLINLFMFIFFPVKLLDIVFSHWPRSVNMAAVLYCVAKKK